MVEGETEPAANRTDTDAKQGIRTPEDRQGHTTPDDGHSDNDNNFWSKEHCDSDIPKLVESDASDTDSDSDTEDEQSDDESTSEGSLVGPDHQECPRPGIKVKDQSEGGVTYTDVRDKTLSSRAPKQNHKTKKKYKNHKTKNINISETAETDRDKPEYTEETPKVRHIGDVMVVELIPNEVILSDNEIKVLSLNPKFQVINKLTSEEFEIELGVLGCKTRWEQRRKEEEKLDEEDEANITPEDRMRGDQQAADSRQTFDPQKMSVNLNKKRATDVKGNKKVTLPKALSAKAEAIMEVRNEAYRDTFNDHVAKHCDKKGGQKLNLTPEEQVGLDSLKKRTKNHEILIVPSNKSG